VPPLGVHAIEEMAAAVRVPICATGGITPDNIEQLRAIPTFVGVHSAIATAPNVRLVTHNLVRRLLTV
jgi:thiamine monophosphate synthase